MRAPLSWIREFTPVDGAVADDRRRARTSSASRSRAIDEPGREISGVVVARILDVVPHPDADQHPPRRRRLRRRPAARRVRRAEHRRRAWSCRSRRSARRCPATSRSSGARSAASGLRRHAVLGARARPRRRPRRHPRARRPTPSSAPTCARCSASTTSCSTCRSRPNRPDAMGIVGVARELAAHFALPFDRARARPGRSSTTLDGDAPSSSRRPTAARASSAWSRRSRWGSRPTGCSGGWRWRACARSATSSTSPTT